MRHSTIDRSRADSRIDGRRAHHLKCWPEFFEPIRLGLKRHDLRRADDRTFHVGDFVLLEEFDPVSETYTGRELKAEITYITSSELPCALSKDALHPNFCILSIKPIS